MKLLKSIGLLLILALLLAACQPATPAAPDQPATTPVASPQQDQGKEESTPEAGSQDKPTPVATDMGEEPGASGTLTATAVLPGPAYPGPATTPDAGEQAGGEVSMDCLVGTWELTEYSAYFSSLMAAAGEETAGQLQFQEMSGSLIFTFNEDGTTEVMAEDWTTTYNVAAAEGQELALVMNGTAEGTFEIEGNRGTGVPTTVDDLELTVLLGGEEISSFTPEQLGAPQGVEGEFSLACSGDTLEYTPEPPESMSAAGDLEPMVFTRVANESD